MRPDTKLDLSEIKRQNMKRSSQENATTKSKLVFSLRYAKQPQLVLPTNRHTLFFLITSTLLAIQGLL